MPAHGWGDPSHLPCPVGEGQAAAGNARLASEVAERVAGGDGERTTRRQASAAGGIVARLVRPCILGCLLRPSPCAGPRWYTCSPLSHEAEPGTAARPLKPLQRRRGAGKRQPGSPVHAGTCTEEGADQRWTFVLPKWLMTPQPGLQQPVAGAAGGWLCPGVRPS